MNKRRMNTNNPAATFHEQHITLAEQLFRPLFAENGAAVDLRCHLIRNPCREIGLDRAGDTSTEGR